MSRVADVPGTIWSGTPFPSTRQVFVETTMKQHESARSSNRRSEEASFQGSAMSLLPKFDIFRDLQARHCQDHSLDHTSSGFLQGVAATRLPCSWSAGAEGTRADCRNAPDVGCEEATPFLSRMIFWGHRNAVQELMHVQEDVMPLAKSNLAPLSQICPIHTSFVF